MRFLRFAAVLTLSLLVCTGWAVPVSAWDKGFYRLTDLDTLAGGRTEARGINDKGQVVGYSEVSAGQGSGAFIWTEQDGMQDLYIPRPRFPSEYASSRAYDINNNGVVVGTWDTGPGHAVWLWTAEDGAQMLDFGGDICEPYTINKNSKVVGTVEVPAFQGVTAFIWTPEGGLRYLDTPEGPIHGYAFDINDYGQVVGLRFGDKGWEAYLWTEEGDFRVLFGDAADAEAINNRGQVAGQLQTNGHAYVWDEETGLQDLGFRLGGRYPLRMNCKGMMVGGYAAATGRRAFVWTKYEGMHDLNDLIDVEGWILEQAWDINEHGQIAGAGIDPEGNVRGFLLTPAAFTPVGDCVKVEPCPGYSVTFEQVISAGHTTIAPNPELPPSPEGYIVLGTCCDLSTTAGYSGEITLRISYHDTNLSPEQEANVKLLHWDDLSGSWEDVTLSLDTEANEVSGSVSNLSPFMVAAAPLESEAETGDGGLGNSGSGGCFIATAAFGSYLEPRVRILREFRDKYLLPSGLGRAFVEAYYEYSPPVAGLIARHNTLRALARIVLLPFVAASYLTLQVGPALMAVLLLMWIAVAVVIVRHYQKRPRAVI